MSENKIFSDGWHVFSDTAAYSRSCRYLVISIGWPVTQYPIPAITVPGRMRYSRHTRILYANEIFPHTLWTFYGNEIFPHLRIHPSPHTHRIFYGSFTPPYILSLQCYIMDPLTVFGPPHILSLQCHIMDNG